MPLSDRVQGQTVYDNGLSIGPLTELSPASRPLYSSDVVTLIIKLYRSKLQFLVTLSPRAREEASSTRGQP